MTELDQAWSKMLDDAVLKAGNSGRQDVLDFLRLRSANDNIRKIGVGWLFDTMIEIAGQAVRYNHQITIEREDPHNFARGSSNMVGSCLQLRQGVRCLTIEAGWARTPSDGIMQKGSLAFARISHFGMPKYGAEFRLAHSESLPHWLAEDDSVIDSSDIRQHFDLFIGS